MVASSRGDVGAMNDKVVDSKTISDIKDFKSGFEKF
jgi:hypothetical protein